MDKKELIDKVKKLNFPLGKYALFGSAQMCLRGLRECKNIDIIVTSDLYTKLKFEPIWNVAIVKSGSESLNFENIEIFRDWKPGDWNIKELIDKAEKIEGVPFVRIENVLKWKQLMNREKDIKDIETIKNYLQINK